METGRFSWVLPHAPFLVLLSAAVLAHAPIFGDGLNPDSALYLEQARALVGRGSLEVETTLVPRHPPMMALLVLPFAGAFGFTATAVHALQITMFALAMAALYALASRWGRRAALPACALLAVDPVLFTNMSEGRALAALICFALVTLWGIWRGLDDSRWMMVAAAGASAGYLAADSVGYLFMVAGAAGFAWRFYYVGWAVLGDRGYLAAVGLFSGVVVGWTAYNVLATGTPYTDPRIVDYLDGLLFDGPATTSLLLVSGFIGYFAIHVAKAALPFLVEREARTAAWRLPRLLITDPAAGALFLFIAMVIGVSAITSAAFVMFEPWRSLGSAETYLRYAAVASPLAYLAIARYLGTRSGPGRIPRWVVPLSISLLVVSAGYADRVRSGDAQTAFFQQLEGELVRRGVSEAVSDVAIWLRPNVDEVTFQSIDLGFSQHYVNATPGQIAEGATLLTVVYKPAHYDEQIGRFYFVRAFNATENLPMENLYWKP